MTPSNQAAPSASTPSIPSGRTNYRWIICALLFFSTTINYMDRQVISYLKDFYCTPTAGGGFGWTNSDYANVTTIFTGFYASMTILAGWVIDKIGTKLGLGLSLIVWSIFGIANAFAGGVAWMHMIIRSLFGIGEGGNFPASIKTVAEWFPKRERALATGIFNSGSNVGAMISALFVPFCIQQFGAQSGWKWAFIITGSVGFLWLIFWFWLYEPPAKQKRLSKAEYDYIHSDRDETASAQVKEDKSGKKVSVSLFSFQGRLPQAGFIGITGMLMFLCLFVYYLSTKFPDLVPKDKPLTTGAIILYCGVGAMAFFVSLATQARRWHDLGKPGSYILLNLIPGIGTLISILMLATRPGTSGPNQFGERGQPVLLGYRQTWAFFFGKFCTDGIWWFYLFWLPDYLIKQFGMTTEQVKWPTFLVYGISIVGSVYGGSIPMTLMKRGMPVYRARMTAMLIIAIFPLSVLLTQYFGDVGHFGKTWAPILAIAMISIGAAAHQAWSANLFTTVSDMFPKKAVGSVTGIGAMAGGLGGVIVQKISGSLTDQFKANPQHAYFLMFILCGLSYLLAWGLMKAFVPRHEPITDL